MVLSVQGMVSCLQTSSVVQNQVCANKQGASQLTARSLAWLSTCICVQALILLSCLLVWLQCLQLEAARLPQSMQQTLFAETDAETEQGMRDALSKDDLKTLQRFQER